jgi:hypothetical protein
MFGPWYLAAIHHIDGWRVPRGTGHAPGRSQERLFSKDNALITERLQQKKPGAGQLRTPQVEHKVDAIQDAEGVFPVSSI